MKTKNTLLICIIFAVLMVTSSGSAHVGLTYPIGGEMFVSGQNVTIAWSVIVSHGPADWDIFYSSDGGGTWQMLAENLPQSQLSWEWTVPDSSTAGGIIQIVQDNSLDSDYFDSSLPFTVMTSVPSLTVYGLLILLATFTFVILVRK